MDYQQTLQYLYNIAPMFQQVGSGAYKAGLTTTYQLDEYFGHPHHKFKTIHIAGTNGKGSTSHTLAAILQSAGYRTGLFTSPHLLDFRERIRINGECISEKFVIDFVEQYKSFFELLHPSFFELTTAMAFHYFALSKVDIAVIEVGMGGRLDCTNIITPMLSLITNISLDHTQFLGQTLTEIAGEKAGIIKPQIPVIVSETVPETHSVFVNKAIELHAPITFANEKPIIHTTTYDSEGSPIYQTADGHKFRGELQGDYQLMNMNLVLSAIKELQHQGLYITNAHINRGLSSVNELTGLRGRWQILGTHPYIVCDTGHNIGGISQIVKQLKRYKYHRLHIVIGMVNDKDISGVLQLLPKDATYYFTCASVARALPATQMKNLGKKAGLTGLSYESVDKAFNSACKAATQDDFIYVGGSTFIVADLLRFLEKK